MFVYTSLSCSRETPQIRLCTLIPAAPHESIQCQLSTHHLRQCNEFEALSYVWGDMDGPQPIMLNGKSFLVSKNLHIALHHLRSPTRPRTLWIDAICINQKDDDERNAQVALMGQIYRSATSVVSWLGTDSLLNLDDEMKHTQDFIRHVEFLRTHQPFLEYLNREDSRTPYEDVTQHVNTFDGGLWSFQILIGERTEQPWYWKRAWITQEVVLARSWAIQVGPQTISNKDIEVVCEFLGLPSVRLLMEERYQERILRARLQQTSVVPISLYRILAQSNTPAERSGEGRHLKNPGPWPLLELLRYNRSRLCLDPRDKVYSVLGISDLAGSNHSGLSINYKASIAEVYMGAVQAIIESSSSLEVLCSTTLTPSAEALQLPSWVPNWSEEKGREEAEQPISYGHQSATKGTLAEYGFSVNPRGTLLEANGFRFGTITDLKDRFMDTSKQAAATRGRGKHVQRHYAFYKQFPLAFEWAAQVLKPQPLSPETFRRTCAVGLLDHTTGDSFQELMEQLVLCPSSGQAQALPVDQLAVSGFSSRYRMMVSAIDDRCLFTVDPVLADSSVLRSGGGVIGIGPSGVVRRGDLVCLLLGCSAPVILRPINEGLFVIVCAVYIDCLMDGRALDSLKSGLFEMERFRIK